MRERPKVGEILVAAGIIDRMQLDAALGEQTRWGRRLGVTLIKLGMVEEGHLIRALAKQLDLPVASLAGKKISPEVIALVPARVASEHGVIPLFIKKDGPTDQLFLGMEDPSNLAVLDDLSFRTGMEIHPVMVGPSELGEAIDRYYHGRHHGGPPAVDPFVHQGDTMGHGSLRVVTDDSAQPGTAPATLPPAKPPTPTSAPVAAQPAATHAVPESEAPIELFDAVNPRLDEMLEDVQRATQETERTRIVAKAIAQLLIEKGLISYDELQAQIAQLKAAVGNSPETD